jgi:hypothetical protein
LTKYYKHLIDNSILVMRMRKKILSIIIMLLMITILISGCSESTDESTDDETDEETNGDETSEDETDEEPEEDPDAPPTNLIIHLKFDETSGTTASDSAGDYDGIVYGDAIWSTGKKDNSLYFDGVDDYVKLPDEAITAIGSLTQGTIAFWLNYTSILDVQSIIPIFFIGNQNKDDHDSIFIIEIGHSDTEAGTFTTDPSNKNLYVTWTDWVTDNMEPILCYDTNENLQESTWIHFALVVGPNGNTGYLNGVELDNRRYNFGTVDDQMFLSEIPVKELFTIGYGKTHVEISPDFVYYKGYIDDLRIYNEPLNQSQIQNLL